jgi:hypothetical protein
MTRKDFELIAAALRSARVPNSVDNVNKAQYNNGIDNAAAMVAKALAGTNPRFNHMLFLKASGPAT